MSNGRIKAYIEASKDRFMDELREIVRQPSISAQDVGVKECAQLIAKALEKRGFQVRLLHAGGQPAVYAELKGKSSKKLLFYNHYDVQPPEPLEAWDSPPFAAEIKEGRIYARGVSDHKGSMMARIHAIDAILATEGELPCTVKFIIDGEEESGSPSLKPIVEQNLDLLKADAALYAGGAKDEKDRPTVRCGHKGMCYVQLTAKGANQDLHSRWATIVPNPAWRLLRALATLKSQREEVLIEGFYDDVDPITPEDEEAMRKMPFATDVMKQNWGLISLLKNVDGLDALKTFLFTPTCNIAGFTSGYGGKGGKTVLPCTASAKLDMRLIPHQRPHDIYEKVKRHLAKHGFSDVQVDLLWAAEPARTPLHEHIVRLVVDSTRRIYGQEPLVSPLWGGSAPRYLLSDKRFLGIPTVADTGVSNADSRHHGPNENLRISDYFQNVEHMADVIMRF